MLLGLSQSEIEDWKASLHTYEKVKRTKRPFGKQQPEVKVHTKMEVIDKEMRFNPVLQSFRDEREQSRTIEHEQIQKMNNQIKHLKNNYKYNTDYDIITCNPTISLPPQYKSQSIGPDNRKKEYKDLTYNQFNIINGKGYNEDYLEKKNLKNQKRYERRIYPKNWQKYDIIGGGFRDNHSEQYSSERSRVSEDSMNRSQEMRTFDPVIGRYYNPEQEEEFQKDLKKREQSHGKDINQKLPPSYVKRESFVQQWNAPPNSVVQELDEKKERQKKRYQMRQIIEDEYKLRNQYLTEQKDQEVKNRVHNGRILEEKGKEFNILNAQRYENSRAERLYGKQITGPVYELKPPVQSPIKQRGFAQFQ